jgi:alpha-N-arabinofuranosidase
VRALLAIVLSLLAGAAAAQPVARFDHFTYQGRDPPGRTLTVAAGEYRNPILSGFYSDPSLVRVGNDYYLVSSTFTYFPGIPVFHSRDLVNWTQIGNAIDRPGQLDFGSLGISRGVFAPDISHRDGVFYILNTCVDCGGNFLITATNPAGPWSDPVWLPEIDGIDPSLFFDADGRAYLLNTGPPPGPAKYDGHRAIWIQEFDVAARRMVGPRTVLVDGGVRPAEKPIWIEGPHIFRHQGWYYLIAAEGGTAEGHSQVVLRARQARGPYAPYPGNPILTQRGLDPRRPYPITSAGHADFVRTPAGEWWATFLAARPYEDDHYNTGRETFLLPVEWRDGWPVILPAGRPIPEVLPRPKLPRQPPANIPMAGPFVVRDDFDGPALAPNWMMIRNPRQGWHGFDRGWLTMRARPDGLGDFARPSFIGRRQQHAFATAETVVDFMPSRAGDEAGLAAFQNDEFWWLLCVGLQDGRRVVQLRRRAGPADPAGGVLVASAPAPPGPVRLRIEARGGLYDFSYADVDGWQALARGADGKILSTRTAGGFVGALFGLYAHAG